MMHSRNAIVSSMLIGEALNRRADLTKRIGQLRDRVGASVLVQEGDEPPERAEDLLAELGVLCDELESLVARINHTNASSRLPSGKTVTEALARRDVLELRRGGLRAAVSAATERGGLVFRRSEVRMVRQIAVKDVQAQIDGFARERRELDTLLQQHNWTAPLIS